MPAMKLENWSLRGGPNNDGYSSMLIRGQVFGHDRFSDGSWINTSVVKRVDSNGLVTTENGREYQLGEPEPQYEAQFPNAKERFCRFQPESRRPSSPSDSKRRDGLLGNSGSDGLHSGNDQLSSEPASLGGKADGVSAGEGNQSGASSSESGQDAGGL